MCQIIKAKKPRTLTPKQTLELLKYLEEQIEHSENGYFDREDDPLLFENYKCETFRNRHCILIPTDSIPFFDPFSGEQHDKELYNLDQFQTVPIGNAYLPVLIIIVQHLINCIFNFVCKNRTEIFQLTNGEEGVRLFFAVLQQNGGYMHHMETSIYTPDITAFYNALCIAYDIHSQV